MRYAKFSSKSDVYAAGIIFLELMSLHPPNSLHQLWPEVLDIEMPRALSLCLSGTLQENPDKRNTFYELFQLLGSEEGKKIAEQENEENEEEFFDVSGAIQDIIKTTNSGIYSQSSSKFF
jgi:serine/threonine protein kinase